MNVSQFLPDSGNPELPARSGRAGKEPDGNPAALLSFVFGIIICVPLVTSLVAVVLGAIGLRKSRHPLAGGRSMAIGGLALGVIGVALWSTAAGFFVNRWVSTGPQRELARRFIRD